MAAPNLSLALRRPYPIPWLGKKWKPQSASRAKPGASHIYDFKGRVARCSTYRHGHRQQRKSNRVWQSDNGLWCDAG
jgi:hypothetical protein